MPREGTHWIGRNIQKVPGRRIIRIQNPSTCTAKKMTRRVSSRTQLSTRAWKTTREACSNSWKRSSLWANWVRRPLLISSTRWNNWRSSSRTWCCRSWFMTIDAFKTNSKLKHTRSTCTLISTRNTVSEAWLLIMHNQSSKVSKDLQRKTSSHSCLVNCSGRKYPTFTWYYKTN